jgi:hypothetical protein
MEIVAVIDDGESIAKTSILISLDGNTEMVEEIFKEIKRVADYNCWRLL